MPSHNLHHNNNVQFSRCRSEFLLKETQWSFCFQQLQSVSLLFRFKGWWRLAGSNRWPPACKAGALPAELNPHIVNITFTFLCNKTGLAFLRKSHGGSNMPQACLQEPPFESILDWKLFSFNNLLSNRHSLPLFYVVGQNGLEPSTSRLSVVCSSQLSYWPIFRLPHHLKVQFSLYLLNWITHQ